MKKNNPLYTKGWSDYELIDAGGSEKLERWGDVITIRPELQAYFKSKLPKSKWQEMAHLKFIPTGKQKGKWQQIKPVEEKWQIQFHELTANLATTQFKHLGMFPEQATNWEVLREELSEGKNFLNLFAYTGFASIVARSTGASVTHVDSVKQLITWAKENMESSGLDDIRWICDDALKFASKEVKRGNKYNVIVMDPPAFGLGAKGERWKIEEKLDVLIATAYDLLNKGGLLILNTYSPRVELSDIANTSTRYFKPNNTSLNELWMETKHGNQMFYGHLLRARK